MNDVFSWTRKQIKERVQIRPGLCCYEDKPEIKNWQQEGSINHSITNGGLSKLWEVMG